MARPGAGRCGPVASVTISRFPSVAGVTGRWRTARPANRGTGGAGHRLISRHILAPGYEQGNIASPKVAPRRVRGANESRPRVRLVVSVASNRAATRRHAGDKGSCCCRRRPSSLLLPGSIPTLAPILRNSRAGRKTFISPRAPLAGSPFARRRAPFARLACGVGRRCSAAWFPGSCGQGCFRDPPRCRPPA